MAPVTSEHLGHLVQLQKLEIQMHQHQMVLDHVDERVTALDASLKGFDHAIESKKTMISQLQEKYRAWESDVQDIGNSILKSEEKLRLVKTNKEYQSGLKEIEDLKAKSASIEDHMIACLEEIEATDKELLAAQADFKEQQHHLTQEKEAIVSEANRTHQKLEQLQADRDGLGDQITRELLVIFNRVKSQQPDGLAIVQVLGAVCQGCNMNIPPQMYNELQREDSLKMCPSCERLIYWQRTDERSE